MRHEHIPFGAATSGWVGVGSGFLAGTVFSGSAGFLAGTVFGGSDGSGAAGFFASTGA